jgi:hypothetical protein
LRPWHLRVHESPQRAKSQHTESEPHPVHERRHRDLDVRGLLPCLELRHHDIQVFSERAPNRRFRRWLILVLPEEPASGIHLGQLGTIPEDGHFGRHHLLAAIVGDPDAVVPNPVVANLHLLAGLHQQRLVLLQPFPGKAHEHQDDANMNQVAAVAALVAANQADERREEIGTARLLAHACALPELL